MVCVASDFNQFLRRVDIHGIASIALPPDMVLHDDESNQPLAGVVLCCTSISADVRSKLADTATQMGATLRLDLTSDVTHLLVGNVETPKYRYVAKERPDICILRVEFVEAVRAAWISGDDDLFELSALETAYALPLFFGLKLCVTKFETLELQTYYADTVRANGGVFSGDLTKDVTHLIAAVPEGAKYVYAKNWGIPVVSAKWFRESMERGMVLDERLYAPELPEKEQGQGAFRVGERKRKREEVEGQGDAVKRKVRRVASMRLEGQSQEMWSGMVGEGRSKVGVEEDAWKDRGAGANEAVKRQREVAEKAKAAGEDESRGLFAGRYILLHGFEAKRASRLRDFLTPNGAVVVTTAEELENASFDPGFQDRYLLTPHAMPDDQLELPDIPPSTLRTTEWWVERCIHNKRLLNPDEDVLSQPLGASTVSGLGAVFISTTGFTGVDLRQTAEVVKLMGAEYQEVLLPSTQILVSASSVVKKEKAFYASKHNIPVVTADWLWDSLKAGAKAPFDTYRVSVSATDYADFPQALSAKLPASGEESGAGVAESAQRREGHPKRLSNSRRRTATPSLSLQSSKAMSRSYGPFVHEDNDEDDNSASFNDGAFSAAEIKESMPISARPLSEISPNASPTKNDAVSLEDVLATAKASKARQAEIADSEPVSQLATLTDSKQVDHEASESLRNEEYFNEQITSLMERRRALRHESSDTAAPQKRKSRPLGRNLSGILSRSMSASARSDPATHAFPPDLNESHSPVDGFSMPSRQEQETPSTQLGYETLETEAHRKQMSKKMGTDLHSERIGERVASLGTVQDSAFASRRTGRDRTRTRQRPHAKT